MLSEQHFGGRKMFFESILKKDDKTVYISPDSISINPRWPRRYYDGDKLAELSKSIKKYGILLPLCVRKVPSGYELVDGERRIRAAKAAGLRRIPCIVLDMSERQAALISAVRNTHREHGDFIQEAETVYTLMQVYGFSAKEIAENLCKSEKYVQDRIDLLKIPGEILFVIRERGLTDKHALALLPVENYDDMVSLLRRMVEGDLSPKSSEKLVNEFLGKRTLDSSTEPLYVIKDVGLFINSVAKGLDIMRRSGINASYLKDETDTDIVLTIKIPKKKRAAVS